MWMTTEGTYSRSKFDRVTAFKLRFSTSGTWMYYDQGWHDILGTPSFRDFDTAKEWLTENILRHSDPVVTLPGD